MLSKRHAAYGLDTSLKAPHVSSRLAPCSLADSARRARRPAVTTTAKVPFTPLPFTSSSLHFTPPSLLSRMQSPVYLPTTAKVPTTPTATGRRRTATETVRAPLRLEGQLALARVAQRTGRPACALGTTLAHYACAAVTSHATPLWSRVHDAFRLLRPRQAPSTHPSPLPNTLLFLMTHGRLLRPRQARACSEPDGPTPGARGVRTTSSTGSPLTRGETPEEAADLRPIHGARAVQCGSVEWQRSASSDQRSAIGDQRSASR